MKRNMDLIRLLLLRFEAGEPPLPVDGFEDRDVLYNCLLMSQAGLIDASFINTSLGGKIPAGIRETYLTWAGQDFLSAARNETVWHKVSDVLVKRGVPATFEVLKAMLVVEIKRHVGLP